MKGQPVDRSFGRQVHRILLIERLRDDMNSITPSSKAARQTLDDNLDAPQSREITARPDQDPHWHIRIGDSQEVLEIDPASLVTSVPSILMATSTHRVSTIIPVFNGARYLGEAIESVMVQTHPALDVIVVDDGSTDGSAAVAQSFGDRVFTVRQQNLGQAAALNAGLALATGEYVAFLDADDLWEPEKAARQYLWLRFFHRIFISGNFR